MSFWHDNNVFITNYFMLFQIFSHYFPNCYIYIFNIFNDYFDPPKSFFSVFLLFFYTDTFVKCINNLSISSGFKENFSVVTLANPSLKIKHSKCLKLVTKTYIRKSNL